MIHIKTEKELKIMQAGGKILSGVMRTVLAEVKPGVTLSQLDQLAEKEITKHGAFPSFKTVRDYTWSICACINDVVVHGIPDGTVIAAGDVVGIDCGVLYKDFHTDSAWTIIAGGDGAVEEKKRFLACGILALNRGIKEVKEGNYMYDISRVIQDTVEGAGYGVVRSLVGHGVGKDLHEEPEVPNYVTRKRQKTPRLQSGMTIAIEVIYTMGSPDVVYKGNDGWTIGTKDGTLSGLFEATVAVAQRGCVVLTSIYGASRNN